MCFGDEELVDAITDLDDVEAREVARRMLDHGVTPPEIMDVCSRAMGIIGTWFRPSPGSIAEVTMAGWIVDGILDQMAASPR